MAGPAFITGEVRPGAEFHFINKPTNTAAPFAALVDGCAEEARA
jgi:hypothetical protein